MSAVEGQSVKAKQLVAQLIPRFLRSFPALATRAMEAMFDLVDMEELTLNIEDVQPDNNNAHEQDGASDEGDPGNKNMLGDFINEEEDNGSNWSDKEQDMHVSVVEEKDHVSTNADDDDLGDVFDWY
ncbi:hypothetical protein ABZP36_031993 [Zizania latifolia]